MSAFRTQARVRCWRKAVVSEVVGQNERGGASVGAEADTGAGWQHKPATESVRLDEDAIDGDDAFACSQPCGSAALSGATRDTDNAPLRLDLQDVGGERDEASRLICLARHC